MAVSTPLDGQPTAAYAAIDQDAQNNEPVARPLPSASASPLYVQTRESTTSRGRAQSATSPHNAPPRGITPVSQTRPKQSFDLERKPSMSYGHHRQTSIVHGVHHSRNPSLLSTTTASPLSPAKIMENGRVVEDGGLNNGHVLKKSPSASALQHQAGKDASRMERMRSLRSRRPDEQNGTQAPERTTQTQTVGEYALHHLFTSFVAEAEAKLDRFTPLTGQPEPRIETICGPGVDPAFDQLLCSLGHINRHKPKSVIDAVMDWRRTKKSNHNMLLEQMCPNPEQLQRLQDAYTANTTVGLSPIDTYPFHRIFNDERVVAAELRVQVATYILSRALVEIISQTTTKAMNAQESDYAQRLEDTFFRHLEDLDVAMTHRTALSQANLVVRGELLGVMSGLRLEEVAKRFAVSLAEDYRFLSVKNPPASFSENARNEWRKKWEDANARTPLLLQSMRWLRFATQPADLWAISCDVLHRLATFFAEVHGRHIKHAYADLFEHVLLPIAATGSTEFNNDKWKESLAILRPKVTQMLTKTDHWPYIYPLQAVLLCVSPQDVFASQWMSTITASPLKSRDRSGRSHTLKAICRLVWRYLYRLKDSEIQVARKLDEVVKHVFQGGKKYLVSTDPTIADPLIQLIRIIGYKYRDICFRTIIFPLMNHDLLQAHGDQLSIESLDPGRTVIGIRAFLAIMTDIEKSEQPPFPTTFECDALLDPISRLNMSRRRTLSMASAVSAGHTDRLSRPIVSSALDEVAQGYYVKFCGILGSLTKICDRMFGGEAVLNERIAAIAPKTPRADAFATFGLRKEEIANTTVELRQNYYDLFHVAVEALPRCLSPALPISELVSLLCTGTAHSQPHIAASSAQSLKSIARQSYAQVITLGFARFIFNFDDKYATVSDGGLLGPGHIDNTLRLYVELLQIWIDDLQRKTKEAAASSAPTDDETSTRPLPLDLSGILALVDEVESHGLFFLCSPSQAVRAIAVEVLQLVTKFDMTLGKPCKRIISILEGSSEEVIDVNDERLTLAERSRLQKGLKKTDVTSTLVELCSSDIAHDANLWFKVFPNLVRKSLDICFSTVALTREIVCKRLSHAQPTIEMLAQTNRPRYPFEAGFASASSRYNGRQLSASDITIEQWKLHLVFVCTTMTNVGKQQNLASQNSQHIRKSSKSSTSTEETRIASGTELFPKVVDFIFAANAAVRDAAVVGLGATNATLYQVLLEALHPAVQECLHESKGRVEVHQRTISSPRRNPRTDMLRLGVTHLLSLTVHLLKDPKISSDEYVLEYMAEFAKHLRTWLGDQDVESHLEYHKLRTHFCTFMEGLYDNTKKLSHSTRWLSFQGRLATFSLMENWCGFFSSERQLREEQKHRQSLLKSEDDAKSRGMISSAIEKEKNELQITALNAMSSLCAGPIQFVADSKILMAFDMRRMLQWVNTIFETPSDRTHATGRKALQNLIVYNPESPLVMTQSLKMCYVARSPKALASYFAVVTNVLTEHSNVQVPFWRVLCVGLYTLGNEESGIRMKSARLLRQLEERQGKTSKLQDLDISVSDKTTAVYKLAQFEISCRLARQHSELAFHVFSEFSAYFNELQPDHQRNMVSGMLPWIQTIELQLDRQPTTVVPTATSYMLLVNLFEITVKSRNTMHNEVQALWQALATGPYGGNVQLILDFIISVCLNRREQSFVNYAKQIVVFLAGTAAGARVVEYLLMQIQPTTMVAERRDAVSPPTDTSGLPYIADLNDILPSGAKQNGLSLGQLSMILLVDLIVTPDKVAYNHLVVLLQIILVSWDQYMTIVQEQARELLVHLIHELVISKIEPGNNGLDKDEVEDFIELLRNNDSKIMWSYQDSEVKAGIEEGRAVCTPMGYVIDQCVKIFTFVHPPLREEWGKTSMVWAASCAVRHVACRSFQVFRCTSTTLDEPMLRDMLARLSNTIADEENPDYMPFCLEILTTLRYIITKIEPVPLLEYPQLFWTTCACLGTVYEPEFQEGLSMLSQLLNKMDLSDPAVLKILEESKPPEWQGEFAGIHALIYKGIRSSKSMDRTLKTMCRLIRLPSHKMVGENDRLLFTVLANLPRFLQSFEEPTDLEVSRQSAEELANAAESQNYVSLSKVLQAFASREYRREKDFLNQITQAIRSTFFTALELKSLVFLLGMVNNQASWFKVKTMDVLNVILRDIDMRKPEIASQGPDMISPLLRLLQTEHCQQALEVLDNVIDMTGTPLDGQHLRMSMAGSHTSRAVRREYGTTKSFHGIPEESGWSIPMPAIHSRLTRSNVHAVFSTMVAVGDSALAAVATTPEIEFHHDDNWEYFTDRTATMASEDTRTDGNMGELAMKLDSLDDFFDDDDDDDDNDATPSNRSPRFSGATAEQTTFYDQQALPILHRSLQRSPSMNSQLSRVPTQEMNPGAFAQNSKIARLGLHNRSSTSPATPSSRFPPQLDKDLMSGDEAGDEPEPMSDDDASIGRANTADELHIQNTVRQGGFRAGFRQGLRRLTSTNGPRDASRSTSGGLKSPRMPRLPAMYLNRDPASADP